MRTFRGIALAAFVVTFGSLAATPARADWTINVGYHNPVVSTYGLNLEYIGSNWCFEVGLGWVDAHAPKRDDDSNSKSDSNSSSSDDKSSSAAAAGDIDLKYLFSGGKVRPYLEGGFAVGIEANDAHGARASAGAGGGFVGLGLLFGSPSFYAYLGGAASSSDNAFVQAGLGTNL